MSWFSSKPPDSPFDWRARAAFLPQLFVAHTQVAGKKRPIVVTPRPVAMLLLPTGRVVCGTPTPSDGFDVLLPKPFTRPVPPGTYPVEVSLAAVSADESQVAAARIVFSAEPVASWEAGAGGSGAADPAPSGLAGIAHGAWVAYLDAQTVPLLDKYIAECELPEMWHHDVAFVEGERWQYASLQPDEARPENCAIFTRGDYDGVSVSYWGLDAGGAPVMLVTDCNVIPLSTTKAL